MRHYEIMLLIHPDQSERARVMMDRYVGIIEGGEGQVHRNEDLGRRMLAYPIAKVHKAHYMLMNVECGQETLQELVGALHFSDAVLRHLVIRREEAVSEQSALAKAAEREAARENREYPHDRELAHGRKAPAGAPDAPEKGKGAQAKVEAAADAPDQAGTDQAETGESVAADAAKEQKSADAPSEEVSPAEAESSAEKAAPEASAEETAEASVTEQDMADADDDAAAVVAPVAGDGAEAGAEAEAEPEPEAEAEAEAEAEPEAEAEADPEPDADAPVEPVEASSASKDGDTAGEKEK